MCDRAWRYIMTIMKSRMLAVVLLLSPAVYAADEDIKKTIQALYASTLAAMKEATTKEDIAKIVNGMDAPEWTGTLPAGETVTRVDAIAGLEAMLAIPPEKRPVPSLDFVYVHENGPNVLAVYWVFRETDQKIIGSLVRDTWVRTAPGLRRIRHEKFFPERVLINEGKAVILPQQH